MAFQPSVVGENFVRRQAVGGAAQGARFPGEHHRRQTDAVGFQFAAEVGPICGRGHEVAALGNQAADFFGHAAAQFGFARAERHHHGFGALTQEAKDPVLEAPPHRTDLVLHSTAQAASGVNAATAVTGEYPYRSMARPMGQEISTVVRPVLDTSMETVKAARAPSNASSGRVYMFTLNAATARKLSEIPAAAHAGEGAAGTAAVASATTEAGRHRPNAPAYQPQ